MSIENLPLNVLELIVTKGDLSYVDFMSFVVSNPYVWRKFVTNVNERNRIFGRRLLQDFQIDVDQVDALGYKKTDLKYNPNSKVDCLRAYSKLLKMHFYKYDPDKTRRFRKDRATVFLIDGTCPTSVYRKYQANIKEQINDLHQTNNEKDADAEGSEDENTEEDEDDEETEEKFMGGYGADMDQKLSIMILEHYCPEFRLYMRRGDIIEDFRVSGYRSNGIYFWNGERIIEQYYEEDDHGTVPEEFVVFDCNPLTAESNSNFNPGYWSKPYGNNNNPHTLNVFYMYDVSSVRRTRVGHDSNFYWHMEDAFMKTDSTLIMREIAAKRIHREITTDYSLPPANISMVTIKYNYVNIVHKGTIYRITVDSYEYDNMTPEELYKFHATSSCFCNREDVDKPEEQKRYYMHIECGSSRRSSYLEDQKGEELILGHIKFR